MTSSSPRIVGVSGSPSDPSRTSTLVRATVDRFAAEFEDARTTVVEIGPVLADLGAAPTRDSMAAATRAALEAVETADVLVVGSPAFRAAYSGAFKLFFDWVGQYELVDTPVLLTATGGSDRHALLVEHQMRPLFGFFQSTTLPIGVFGNERDFVKHEGSYELRSVELELRIDQAVQRALPIVRSGRLGALAGADVRRPTEF
ncbi:FMN reductase [Curtobacterium sp. MCBD17_034]|uniref:NAD(P)H-dependent oxidoreductase n=1 Tax=unclassified Curtobacterium TaxID=257496 RepID=UPI000DAA2DEB|nr:MULTISPECIES: NAD(P)H-dependent oxidoreductase [unclassified Curtobacterium]PZF58662.1 FMN reductase [Curtobacterium sp. MCBD17_034]PZM34652.1 FMN reductase [Curtobacterium sp. MCBD17_031]WIE53736.1 NAD(P)H-dependent oxidoreductase [Curtobacterium sp. MCBD17_003]